MSEGSAKPRRFQFTILGIIVATLWSAVFSCGFVLLNRLWYHQLVPVQSEGSAYLVVGFLLFVSMPAAIDGLFGRASRGMIVGIILFVLFLFAINTWGSP
jgi:hypothetical protein